MKKFKPAIVTLLLLTLCFASAPSIALSEPESTVNPKAVSPKSEHSSCSGPDIDSGTLSSENRSIDPGMLVYGIADMDPGILLPANPDVDPGILITP